MSARIVKPISLKEFVGLMALLVSLTALSIDTMLPALQVIGADLRVVDPNHAQYIIGCLFLGFTFGQIVYGPLSDSFGRKTTVYWGLGIFIMGSFLSLIASNFQLMLIGRVLQGFGVASARIASMSITRDLYEGREMARVMSFVMAVFILVPVLAPAIGQLILAFAHWRMIFALFIAASLVVIVWMHFRLPETMHPEDRHPFSLRSIAQGVDVVVKNKTTLGFTVCAGLVFGALVGYLNTAQQIFEDYYHVGEKFALYFALSALSIGAASMTNSAIVRRYGMRCICHYALKAMLVATTIFLYLSLQPEPVKLWQFMLFICFTFFCLGLLFGNLNAIAMEPMGHHAGIAAAVIGSLSSLISVVLGTFIGQAYNHTLGPIAVGFLSMTVITFILQMWLNREHALIG